MALDRNSVNTRPDNRPYAPYGAPAVDAQGKIFKDSKGNIVYANPGGTAAMDVNQVIADLNAQWAEKLAGMSAGFHEQMANIKTQYAKETAAMKAKAEEERARREKEIFMKTRKTGLTPDAGASQVFSASPTRSGSALGSGSLLGEGGKTLLGS